MELNSQNSCPSKEYILKPMLIPEILNLFRISLDFILGILKTHERKLHRCFTNYISFCLKTVMI